MLFRLSEGRYKPAREDDVIAEAQALYTRYFQRGTALTSPSDVKAFLQLKLVEYEHEVFVGLFLDTQHRIISCDVLFHGTIDSAAVYPREVLKAALAYNAAAVIFAHNHPSGTAEPSQMDKSITQKLKDLLAVVDIGVLDHFICGDGIYSFAEQGLL